MIPQKDSLDKLIAQQLHLQELIDRCNNSSNDNNHVSAPDWHYLCSVDDEVDRQIAQLAELTTAQDTIRPRSWSSIASLVDSPIMEQAASTSMTATASPSDHSNTKEEEISTAASNHTIRGQLSNGEYVDIILGESISFNTRNSMVTTTSASIDGSQATINNVSLPDTAPTTSIAFPKELLQGPIETVSQTRRSTNNTQSWTFNTAEMSRYVNDTNEKWRNSYPRFTKGYSGVRPPTFIRSARQNDDYYLQDDHYTSRYHATTSTTIAKPNTSTRRWTIDEALPKRKMKKTTSSPSTNDAYCGEQERFDDVKIARDDRKIGKKFHLTTRYTSSYGTFDQILPVEAVKNDTIENARADSFNESDFMTDKIQAHRLITEHVDQDKSSLNARETSKVLYDGEADNRAHVSIEKGQQHF